MASAANMCAFVLGVISGAVLGYFSEAAATGRVGMYFWSWVRVTWGGALEGWLFVGLAFWFFLVWLGRCFLGMVAATFGR